jgi:hypothetical protein
VAAYHSQQAADIRSDCHAAGESRWIRIVGLGHHGRPHHFASKGVTAEPPATVNDDINSLKQVEFGSS